MRISSVLADKGSFVATTRSDATVSEAVNRLSELGIGALVVSDDGAHIDGIVSERDVVRRLAVAGTGMAEEPVWSIMSRNVHTCSLDDDTESLVSLMTDRRIRHVPVVSMDRLAGIVSIGDLVRVRMLELERERKELVDYITAR